MMSMTRIVLLTTTTMMLSSCSRMSAVRALREDQLGTYDWHKKFIGETKFVSFDSSNNNIDDEQIIFITDHKSNIIASIASKTGEIKWRVMNDEFDVVDYATLVSPTTVQSNRFLLTQSSNGKFIRAIDLSDGTMIWESIAYTEAAASEELFLESAKDVGIDIVPLGKDVDGDTIIDFLVLAKGTVQLRSLADGVTQWKTNVAEAISTETNEKCHLQKICSEGTQTIYAIGVSMADSAICGAALRASDGYVMKSALGGAKLSGIASSKSSTTVDIGNYDDDDGKNTNDNEGSTTTKYSVFCAGQNDDKVIVALFKSKKGAVSTIVSIDASNFFDTKGSDSSIIANVPVTQFGISDDKSDSIELNAVVSTSDEATDRNSRAAGAMTLSNSNEVVLLRMLDDSKMQLIAVRAFPEKNKVAFSFHNNEFFVVESSKVSSSSVVLKMNARALIGNGNDEIHVVEWQMGDESGTLKKYAYVKSVFVDPKNTNAIVMHRDAFLSFVDKKKKRNPVWSREESIATASESMFGYLPEPASVYADSHHERTTSTTVVVQPSLKESARVQYLALAARLNRADAEMRAELAKLRRARGTKLLPTSDEIGFRRSLIFLTPSGSLLALHNGDGRVLWRTHLGCSKNNWKFTALMPWKIGEKDALLTIAKNSTTTIVHCVYQDSGNIAVDATYFDFAAVRLVPLEVSGENSRILLVDDVGKASIYPTTKIQSSAIVDGVRKAISRNSYYVVDQERNEVRGYAFSLTDKEFGATGIHSWTITFPPESGNIVGFSRKPSKSESVHAWVKVPGDRSTMFKYVNPNVFFIATDDGRGIHAHLVEGVSGRIIYRVHHAKAKGPVFASLCENWITYSYYDTDAQRHAISVLEVYDDSEARKNKAVSELVLKSLFGSSNNKTSGSSYSARNTQTDDDEMVLSSFTPPPLRVLGQSYFIRPGTKFMRVTTSARGITGHQVLLGTDTDQVVALDKRWLDPRRPTKPSTFDQEEGLIPYMEVLPLMPASWVTNKNVVARLKDVITAPTDLESTVLCMARGVDVFYTRLHPSQSFDALDEEFSYGLLIISLLVVGIGALVTHGMSVKATSRRLWK